jgi:hypothetical protein
MPAHLIFAVCVCAAQLWRAALCSSRPASILLHVHAHSLYFCCVRVRHTAVESDLVFLGLVGLQDPPRPEVKGAISEVCAKLK